MDFAQKILRFYRQLRIAEPLPPGFEVMNPYREKTAFDACKAFYHKYYGDNGRRYLILGINPGRYGAGITGIPFTDPVKLEQLGISTPFQKKAELSGDFVYAMIARFGGPEKFYRKFFINSVSPLGFIREGKNVNYYDTPALKAAVTPFIKKSLSQLVRFDVHRTVAFCMGEGANFKHLSQLNEELRLFDRIIPLSHPRFILQYRRKQLDKYLDDYLHKLNSVP